MNESAEILLIRKAQRRIVLEEPVNGKFKSSSSVETGGSWIGKGKAFDLNSRREHLRPFGCEELEL